ncbi:MAG TPA: hypothetical protein VEV62_12600 [Parafilimonas sp.]|nr:hypothetical protein [Parafilimonas sp.]
MKRRNFIQLSAFATAAISLPLLHSCTPSLSEQAMSQPVFLSRLFDENTIKETGKAYLKKASSENDEDKLVKLLADNNNIINSKDEKSIHQYLDKKIHDDFETGNTVLVKGWVLAVTEARQCALFSLTRS